MSDIRNMTTEELAKTIAFHTSYSGSYVVNSHLRELARRLEAAEAANKALNTATEIERLRELVAFNEDQRRMLFDAATKLEADRDRLQSLANVYRTEVMARRNERAAFFSRTMKYEEWQAASRQVEIARADTDAARAANGEVGG